MNPFWEHSCSEKQVEWSCALGKWSSPPPHKGLMWERGDGRGEMGEGRWRRRDEGGRWRREDGGEMEGNSRNITRTNSNSESIYVISMGGWSWDKQICGMHYGELTSPWSTIILVAFLKERELSSSPVLTQLTNSLTAFSNSSALWWACGGSGKWSRDSSTWLWEVTWFVGTLDHVRGSFND